MHTTQESWQASLHDPVVASGMGSVFPSYKLPVVNAYPSALIANTDPHDQPGTLHLTKVNSLIVTDFLLRPMTWMNTHFENLRTSTSNHCKV